MRTILAFLLFSSVAFGFQLIDDQVNIGDRVKPDASAQLQISTTSKGFLGARLTTAQRDAIVSPAIGLEIFNTTDGVKEIYDGLTWTSVGGGNSFFRVTQVAHGRAIGDAAIPVYLTAGVWTDAKADQQSTLATHAIVQVIDVDTFVVASSGRYQSLGHGLTVEQHYYVSETVGGGLTVTEPDVYSNPIVFVEDANIIHILPFRAANLNPSAGAGPVNSVFGRAGDILATLGDYAANLISFSPTGNVAAVDVQAAIAELDVEKATSTGALTALAAYNTDGLITQIAADTFTGRTLVAGSTRVGIVDGDGVAGNPTIDVNEANVDHDNLLNYVANQHIDWTAATDDFLTSGNMSVNNGSFSGNISLTGDLNGRFPIVDGAKLDGIEALADVTDAVNVDAAGAVMDGDFGVNGLMARTAAGTYSSRTLQAGSSKVVVIDGDGALGDPSIDVDESQIDINNLLNFDANAYVDHSTVLIDTSDPNDGLLGGGDLTASRTLRVDVNSLALDPAPDNIDEFLMWDIGTNLLKKITFADFISAVPVVGEANTASNLGLGLNYLILK